MKGEKFLSMNIISLEVPKGTRYISEWNDYELPFRQCIVDKGVTGCGYTELCLSNNRNVVLCSPRKMLLENKQKKHLRDRNILYLKNEIKNFEDIAATMNDTMSVHIMNCLSTAQPIKFMVTYDSAHYIIDYLHERGLLDQFTFVVDEFQSIFVDSYFKASIENSFLEIVSRCPNVIYLSATPMLEKYLSRIPEFAALDYYQLDWSKSGSVDTLIIQRRLVKSLSKEALRIIDNYREGNFPITVNDKGEICQSKEAVFYFNSVKDITKILRDGRFKPEEVNILCSDTDKNLQSLKKAGFKRGEIPMENEPNKMFTFCTSTCYVGADFYSKCASTYVFADPNLQCLAVDISLDLPQIAGRQRDRENPFKNNIVIFYKTLRDNKKITREDFDRLQAQRREDTEGLLRNFYENMDDVGRRLNLKIYKRDFEKRLNKGLSLYGDNFMSISEKMDRPVYNKFIEIAHERAWEVAQEDYQDRISVTRAIDSLTDESLTVEQQNFYHQEEVYFEIFLDEFNELATFDGKLELYCRFRDSFPNNEYVTKRVEFEIKDPRFKDYYTYLGTATCKAHKFRDGELKALLVNETKGGDLREKVLETFTPGNRFPSKEIKATLAKIYQELSISRTAKAADIAEWFEIKAIQIWSSKDSKRINGFELLSIK